MLDLGSSNFQASNICFAMKVFYMDCVLISTPAFVWLYFLDRSVNKKINNIRERALRTAYKDTSKDICSNFMNQIFEEKDTPYTLRSGRNIWAPKPNTAGCGIENARFLGARIWHTMPSSLKESETLNSFKRDKKTISLIATVDDANDLLKI